MAYFALLGDPPLPCVVCISEEEAHALVEMARRTSMERLTEQLRQGAEEFRVLFEELKALGPLDGGEG